MKDKPIDEDERFRSAIDELQVLAESDPELKDGLDYLEEKGAKRGVSIYEEVYRVLHQHIVNEKAKEWRDSKHD